MERLTELKEKENELNELQEKYDKLLLSYEKLQHDFSENTIIQSMADMKTVYETQKKKLDKMNDIIYSLHDSSKTVKTLLNTMSNNMTSYSKKYESMTKYELRSRLQFIEEIVEASLKIKNEIYYLD